MLTHLHISHYALIDSLDIDLREGYTVITGETGAGKSILLGALGLLLGARADARVVMNGAQKCVVEATFSLDEPAQMEPFFAENDLEFDPSEIVIRRELTAAGKSRAFVNDSPVLLSVLKPLGALLIDIHSQHQNQLLCSEEFLLGTLDLVAGDASELQAYSAAFSAYQQARQAHAGIRQQAERDTKEQELLRFQLKQLEEFGPREGEQQELEEEQSLLAHAEEIKSGLYQAIGSMSDDECDILQRLRQSRQALDGVSEHLSSVEELSERIESARIELADIVDELQRSMDHIDFNPQRLQYVDERLSTLYKLQRQHNVSTDAALVETMEQLSQRLDAIDNFDAELERLAHAEEAAYQTLVKAALDLSVVRAKAGTKISQTLTESIATLGMPHGRVEFSISQRPEPQADGQDQLTLLFSANKSVPMQNVQDIASGGEVARLMLALKAYTAEFRQLPTIVFDEIDTGVSGTMAERMGQVMQQLAQHCQVLCITHLPQIAALGDQHLRVYKEEDATGTHSHIAPLSTEERIGEIANMLSGSALTDAALLNAKSLLGL